MTVTALVFDVFGTVVDWRGSIIEAGASTGHVADWGAVADEWRREGYLAPLVAFHRGEAPWRPHDDLMRARLPVLAERHRIPPEHHDTLLAAWHHLRPWLDAVVGLERLHPAYVLAPLSNGGFAQLTTMGRAAGLPWDCILSTDLFRSYKPDPATYRGAVDLLGPHPADRRSGSRIRHFPCRFRDPERIEQGGTGTDRPPVASAMRPST